MRCDRRASRAFLRHLRRENREQSRIIIYPFCDINKEKTSYRNLLPEPPSEAVSTRKLKCTPCQTPRPTFGGALHSYKILLYAYDAVIRCEPLSSARYVEPLSVDLARKRRLRGLDLFVGRRCMIGNLPAVVILPHHLDKIVFLRRRVIEKV